MVSHSVIYFALFLSGHQSDRNPNLVAVKYDERSLLIFSLVGFFLFYTTLANIALSNRPPKIFTEYRSSTERREIEIRVELSGSSFVVNIVQILIDVQHVQRRCSGEEQNNDEMFSTDRSIPPRISRCMHETRKHELR